MKRNLFSSSLDFARITTVCLFIFLFSGSVKAQILAEWPLNSKAVPVPAVPLGTNNVAIGVVASPMTVSASTFTNTDLS